MEKGARFEQCFSIFTFLVDNFRNHYNDTFSSLLLNVPQLLGKYLVVLGGVVGEVVADVGADLVVLPLNHVHRVLLCVPNNRQAFQVFERPVVA